MQYYGIERIFNAHLNYTFYFIFAKRRPLDAICMKPPRKWVNSILIYEFLSTRCFHQSSLPTLEVIEVKVLGNHLLSS